MSRPHFVRAFLHDLTEDWDRYGWRGILPLKAAPSLLAGALVAWTVPDFWGADQRGLRLDVFVGLTAINGLLLALAWSAFGKIYETAAAPGFSGWLTKHNLHDGINFQVSFIQGAQAAAVTICGCNLVLTLYGVVDFLPLWLHRAGMMLAIGSTIYAFLYATGAVIIMQDMVRYRSAYDNGVARNVVDMPRNEGTK